MLGDNRTMITPTHALANRVACYLDALERARRDLKIWEAWFLGDVILMIKSGNHRHGEDLMSMAEHIRECNLPVTLSHLARTAELTSPAALRERLRSIPEDPC